MEEKSNWWAALRDQKNKYAFLLLFILCYLFISPFLAQFPSLKSLMSLFLTGILISGVYSVIQQRNIALIATALAVPMFLLVWGYQFTGFKVLDIAGDIFGILFMALIATILFTGVVKAKRVDLDVIFGAIIVYLFIGTIWALFYEFIEKFFPGSFSVASAELHTSPSTLTYFSFVTLTTLGYGDITPISPQARSFAYLEALIGQIYLTVLIARLVGLHIVHAEEKS